MSGSAGSLLSRWLGGAAGSVALKDGTLLQGKGDEARDATLDPLGLWLREGARDGFLEGLHEGLGERERECLDAVRDSTCLGRSPTLRVVSVSSTILLTVSYWSVEKLFS